RDDAASAAATEAASAATSTADATAAGEATAVGTSAPPAAPPSTVAPGPARARRPFDRSIVEGPIPAAVRKLAWPTMLANVIGGLQGIVDHAMVGNYVGYTGNAAIGVSWQIFLVVMVFISS